MGLFKALKAGEFAIAGKTLGQYGISGAKLLANSYAMYYTAEGESFFWGKSFL